MHSLDKIAVTGFKSINQMELELYPLNLLLGANGAGKSNFIGVFELLNQIVNQNLQLFVGKVGGADQLLHYGRETTDELRLHLQFGRNAYECVLVPTTNDTLIFAEETVYYHSPAGGHQKHRSLGSGHKETRLYEDVTRSPRGMGTYVLDAMRSWQIYHFHDTSDSAKMKGTSDLDDNRFLRPDAANLAAFLYLLQKTNPLYYQSIVDTVRLVAPFFDDFMLRPSPFNLNKIKLEWREKGSDTYFDATLLSDGTLRFISLATLMLQPPDTLPATILLDEPELGLHPYAIAILADLLQSAAEQTQVIVSTQSVTLVNQFEPEDIIVVDREEGESVFRRLSEDQISIWLDDYALGDLWEKNILGGRPTAA
jgi:predicted ATPase